ncbi:MAG TPA: right-handed parallel beta-helix repeat-containing protein [Vicinamibacterales bacterium]|nr:right-handed parallel beta-helix repeat-containing protein [Vicinamibacterales bacterium]
MPGDTTIEVCSGTYREQVVITQPMIITGLDDGSGLPAVVAVPAAGLVGNVSMPVSGLVAAQVVLRDTWGVQLENLTIDGAGAACAAAVGASKVAGVALLNMLSDDPSWISTYVGQNEIRNQGGSVCDRSSTGILSENSLVEVDHNYLHHITGDAVALNGASAVVWNNTMWKCGFSAVEMTGLQNATISDNTMTEVRSGAELNASVNINVWTNTMGPWLGYGIVTHNGSLSWIDSNYIESTFFGVYLDQSLSDRVTDNWIVTTQSIGLVDLLSRGGNQIWDNTFNNAPIGIDIDQASLVIDDLGPNTFTNVVSSVTSSGNPF